MGVGTSKQSSEEIPAGLDATILDQIPDHLKERVIQEYNEYKRQYDELHASSENYRVNAEQRFFELEKNLAASNGSLNVETKAAHDLRQTVTKLETKLNEATTKLDDLQSKKDDADNILRDLESARCNLEVEKSDLTQALDRKNHEIDRLNEEWKEISERLNKANEERLDALVKKDEMEMQMNSSVHREQRLQQELSQLQHQKDWLDQELKEKVNDLLTIRKDQAGRYLEMEAQLEQRGEEVIHLEELVATLKENVQELTKHTDEYCEKLKESKDQQMQMEENHRAQIHSQNKLAELYKESASDAESQVKELTSAVSELQKLLKEASTAYTDLENQKDGNIAKLMETIRDKDDDISRMNDELRNANELLEVAKAKGHMKVTEEAIEAMSPTAAAASRLLKSGMTLTQIYSEYARASEELLTVKQEKDGLQHQLDAIFEELHEKAPVLKRQREDYEATLTAVDQLTRQLDAARVQMEKLQVECDEGQRKARHLNRENQRMRQQTADLGQQVRMLLKELEEARGRVVSTDPDMDVSSSEISSSSQIITEKLVTFRGLEDLQMKNQELLAALRDLSEEREEAEKQAMDLRSAELKRQVSTLTEELQMMKRGRDSQVSMVEAVVRQRDMYRVLLAETGSAPLIPPSPHITSTPVHSQKQKAGVLGSPEHLHGTPPPSSSTPARSASPTYEKKMLEEKTKALKDLMEEFNQYREEKRKNDKMLTEQIESLRQQASDAKVQNAKIASQLDYSAERIKVFQNNTESYKKETDALRDKNQKYAGAVIRNEQTIMSLKEDLMAVQERVSRAEVVADNLRVERNMLKGAESRLLQEKENALREQSTQKILLANLQAIQNNLERSDFENKTRLSNRIEMLEKENAGLKNKLDGIDNHHRESLNRVERQLAEAQNECDRCLKYKREAMETLQAKERDMEQLQQKLRDVQKELDKNQASQPIPSTPEPTPMTSGVAEEEIKDLKSQLNSTRLEINNMKAKLEEERSHKEQYQNIASNIETTLKEQAATNQQFKESAESQLTETREANVQLQRQLELSEKERQKVMDENFKLTDNFNKTNGELQKQLQLIQGELQDAVTQRETAIGQEQEARRDLSQQAQIAHQAQDKYERELILHAADVEVLTNLKTEHESFNTRLASSDEAAREAKTALNAAKGDWMEREKLFKGEENKLKQRIHEVQEQNKLLHEELDSMSNQLLNLQQHQEKDEQERAALADEVKSDSMTDRPAGQLVEVIRFLRKEKEITLAKFEVSQAENTRVKQRLEYVEKQLTETSQHLSAERENAQVQMSSAAEHMELMRKVDQLNLITESNKLLRGERNQLAAQLREVETKAKKLEDDINPLQAANRELTAVRDTLCTEKTALVAEVERWRTRTNHLIEQCNKTDPEEYKRLLKERDLSRKQLMNFNEEINKLRAEVARLVPQLAKAESERENLKKERANNIEEIHKQKVELSRLNAIVSKNENDLTHLKSELERTTNEKDKAKTDLSTKSQEVEEKNKTINQLRNVARKYKKEATDALAKLRAQAPTARVTQLEEKLGKTEKELEAMTERLGSADYEKNEAVKRVQELETAASQHQAALDKLTEELKTSKANEATMETANKNLQDHVVKIQDENKKNKDSETKHQQSRSMLVNAKNKLVNQKEIIEKLTAELTEVKLKLEAAGKEAAAQKAASESRVASLEKDLQLKISALQKQVESQQKTPPSSGTSKPTVSAPPVPSGLTVNVLPMKAPSTGPRQVRSTADTVNRGSRMARIGPMLGAPTPTATVMPTTVSVHDDTASPSSQVRPTPPVQPVSPHIEPDNQAPVETTEPEVSEPAPPAAATAEPVPSTSTGRETQPGANKRHRDDGEGSDAEQEMKRPKTQEAETVEVQEVQESVQDLDMVQAEVEVVQAEAQEEVAPAREVGVVEPATQTTEASAPPTAPSAPAPAPSTTTPSTVSHSEHISEQKAVTGEAEKVTSSSGDQGDIIVLDDDEEEPLQEGEEYEDEEEGGYAGGEEGEEEDADIEDYSDAGDEDVVEGDEDDDGYDVIPDDYPEDEEGEVIDEGYENQDEEPMSDNEDGGGTQDAVVIVDDDDEEEEEEEEEDEQGEEDTAANLQAAEPEQPPPTEQPSGSQVAPQPRIQTARFAGRAERPTASRAQQLPPFMLGTNQMEEGDDSIVPSTPTLLQPKTGTDGFQVAISSPQVPQGRFVFGSGIPPETSGTLPSQSELAQLATQEGMDDTRMDLSQFDEGTGQSVPTTPRSRTPPIIAITEAPSQEDEVVVSGSALTTAEVPTGQPAAEGKPPAEEPTDSETSAQRGEEDIGGEESRGEAAAEAVPSTSHEGLEEGDGGGEEGDGGQSDDKPGSSLAGGDKQESGGSRPKRIQRIVWDQSPRVVPAQPQRRYGRGALRPARGQHVTPQRGALQQQQQFFRGSPQAGGQPQQGNVRGTTMRSRPVRGQRSRRSRPF